VGDETFSDRLDAMAPLRALHEKARAEPLPEGAHGWNRHERDAWPHRRYYSLLEDAYLDALREMDGLHDRLAEALKLDRAEYDRVVATSPLGRPLTNGAIQSLANEAERGYDVEGLKCRASNWHLVERYCESFADDDFRLVFRRGDEIREISVGKEAWEVFASG